MTLVRVVSFNPISFINSNLIIDKNYIINKNEFFTLKKGNTVIINKNATLFIEGKLNIINDKENYTKIISEDGTGSIIFKNNKFNYKNLIFENLSKPNLTNYILYGGVNFINSTIKDSKKSSIINDEIFLENPKF